METHSYTLYTQIHTCNSFSPSLCFSQADALDVGMNERDRSTRQERRLDLQSGSSASRGSVMGPSGEITNMQTLTGSISIVNVSSLPIARRPTIQAGVFWQTRTCVVVKVTFKNRIKFRFLLLDTKTPFPMRGMRRELTKFCHVSYL